MIRKAGGNRFHLGPDRRAGQQGGKRVRSETVMPVPASTLPITLDVTTLFVVAIFLTGLLGALLLFAWARDRIPALAWWGAAYLIGGSSAAVRKV